MRLALSILLAAACSLAAADPRADKVPAMPPLLKYDQIMRLTEAKRMAYLRQISKVLVLMEQQQSKYETASTSRLEDLQDQVALLMRLVAILPEAEAVGSLKKAKTPPDKAAATDEKSIPVPDPGTTACAAVTPQQCPVIAVGSSEETDMINAFKNSSANSECIRGGFFGHYANKRYSRGKCVVDADGLNIVKKGFGKDALNCPKGTALCNPALFCWGQEKGSEPFKFGRTCAPLNQTFTANCESMFTEKTGATIAGGKNRACDPASDMKSSNFHTAYDDLVQKATASFKRLCGGVEETKPFQAKFCNECNVIRGHLAKALCEAGPIPPAAAVPEQETPKKDGTVVPPPDVIQ